MTRKGKTSNTGRRHVGQPKEREPGRPSKPSKTEQPGQASAGPPAPNDAQRPAEPSEDFGRRRDIETADEPVEEHDRRYHDRGRVDVESIEPR